MFAYYVFWKLWDCTSYGTTCTVLYSVHTYIHGQLKLYLVETLTFSVLTGVGGDDLESRAVAVPGAVVLRVLSCNSSSRSVGPSEHYRYWNLED